MNTVPNSPQSVQPTITTGRVLVPVPLFDDEGTQRVIAFPRVGRILHGSPIMHWTATPFLARARKIARAALRASLPPSESRDK